MKKRGILLSDSHCGHAVGLTPPRYQYRQKRGSDPTKHNKWAKIQHEAWSRFDDILKRHAPFDVVFFLGDAIDGKGAKSGGTELITASLEDQSEMAVDMLNHVRLYGRKRGGMKIIATHGTPFHVSGADGEDWENIVADKAGISKLGSHEWPEVNGCVFDLKHKIGASSIPHGRATAILRDLLWNDLWAMEDMQPKATVLARGHVHYHIGVWTPHKDRMRWAMSLPALQCMGSKFGARQCSGMVHFGAVPFTVDEHGVFDFCPEIVPIHSQKAVTTVI